MKGNDGKGWRYGNDLHARGNLYAGYAVADLGLFGRWVMSCKSGCSNLYTLLIDALPSGVIVSSGHESVEELLVEDVRCSE